MSHRSLSGCLARLGVLLLLIGNGGAVAFDYGGHAGWVQESQFKINLGATPERFLVTQNDEIVVLDSRQFYVYSLNGVLMRTFGEPNPGNSLTARYITLRPPDEIIGCVDGLAYKVRSDSLGVNIFAQPDCRNTVPIGVLSSGRVAILANCRIAVYSPSLVFERLVTSDCSNTGNGLGGIEGLAGDEFDNIATFGSGGLRLFDTNVQYLRNIPFTNGAGGYPSIRFNRKWFTSGGWMTTDGEYLGGVGFETPYSDPSYVGCRAGREDLVVCMVGTGLVGSRAFLVLRAGYRTASAVLQNRRAPMPQVNAVATRPGSTVTDIDYIVQDGDTATVQTGMLAFVNGGRSLAAARKLQSLVEGTAANLGMGTAIGVEKRVSWDAAADLGSASPFQTVRFSVFAKDDRGPIDAHFVTLPANIPNTGDPELAISSVPLFDADLLDYWFWLLATNDPAITFSNGEIDGVSAPYAGVPLASGTTTTPQGLDFILQRIGARVATAAEIARAKRGTAPGTGGFTPHQYAPFRSIHGHPTAVNEVGVDTGATGGYWFVKP